VKGTSLGRQQIIEEEEIDLMRRKKYKENKKHRSCLIKYFFTIKLKLMGV
jgi:hypothetical protein